MKNVTVIGAGIGGLAAALYCAASGARVTVFDKLDQAGGKAYSFKLGAYRFDAGPSLLTLLPYFEKLFEYSGAQLSDYLKLIRLDPITRYFFSDGSRLDSRPLPQFSDELATFAPADHSGMKHYFEYARQLYETSEDMFLKNPLNHWRQEGLRKSLGNLLLLSKMDVFRTMHQANKGFVTDARLLQFLNRFATYNGSNPYKAPGTLNAIGWVEHGMPVYASVGGIVQIPLALERRCREKAVTFHYNQELSGFSPKGKGFELEFRDGNKILAENLISDIDIQNWYELVKVKNAGKYRRGTPSSSAVVFFWGMADSFPELGLHNIFFSENYEKEFHEIHEKQILPSDPTIYVNISSRVTEQDAPAGKENWFVMVNAPFHRSGFHWDTESLRKRIIAKLSTRLGRKLSRLIEEERILSPDLIEEETGSYRGSLYGMSSNTMTAAFRRHPNTSPYFKRLYHCGGSVHPGGGMPLALNSGIIAAKSCMGQLK